MEKLERTMRKREKGFTKIELAVRLKNIVINEDKAMLTLEFYSPETTGNYKKNYAIEDAKGKIDFNRAMLALGCTKKNYRKWLSRVIRLEAEIKIAVTDKGFVRYIKVMDKKTKEMIKKSLFLDSIEGLADADREWLMSLEFDLLRKEFGH